MGGNVAGLLIIALGAAAIVAGLKGTYKEIIPSLYTPVLPYVSSSSSNSDVGTPPDAHGQCPQGQYLVNGKCYNLKGV